MRKPEQRLADRVRKNIGHLVLIERVENTAAAGTPDACVLGPLPRSLVTWVEHKVAVAPVRSNTRLQYAHPLTIDQKNWHARWTGKGGRSLILIGCAGFLYAVPGRLADEACEYTLEEIGKWEVDYKELVAIYSSGFKVER